MTGLDHRIDHRIGRAQHRALRFVFGRAAGLRPGRLDLQISGHRLSVPYLERGLHARGRAVPSVYVHGFGGDKETWLLLAVALSRKRPLLLLDVPGFGASSAIPGHFATARAQARSLLAILDALGVERADLVGNSMGGGISLRLAYDAPDRVRAVVLLNSIGPPSIEASVERSEFWQTLDRGDNTLIPKDQDSARRMLGMIMARPPWLPGSLLRYAAQSRISARAELEKIFTGWMASPPDERVPEDLAAIRAPVRVVCGEKDRVIHPAVARALADRLPAGELVSLPDIGHVPQVEAPRRTARLVDGFLGRHG